MVLGERTARAALSELYGKKHTWRAPEVERAVKQEDGRILLEFSNVTHWLNLFEQQPSQLPFTIEDEQGKAEITAYEVSGTDKLLLAPGRKVGTGAKLHGAYQMNPSYMIPFDCANLPMLSFYGLDIEE
jgi:hypothetical protein